jgi:hypothetical protein
LSNEERDLASLVRYAKKLRKELEEYHETME